MNLLGSVLIGFITSLLVAEFFGWASVLAKKLIFIASDSLPADQRERWCAEWLAEFENLNEHGLEFTKIIFALRILRAAHKMKVCFADEAERQSRTVKYYNFRISSSRSYREAIYWFDCLKERGTQPNIATFNALMYISPDYQTATEWYQVLSQRGIIPVRGTYNVLIRASNDYQTALAWYRRLYFSFRPNQKTLSWLIDKSPDDQTKLTWFSAMKALEMEIPLSLYDELLQNLKDYRNIKNLCVEMKEEGLQVKLGTAKKLMRKVPDYLAAGMLCELMGHASSRRLLLSFYSHRMSESENHADALQEFVEMRSRGVCPDLKAWHILMGLTEDFELRNSYFSKLKDEGLLPNATTYGLLIAGTNNFANALTLLEKLLDENLKPTSGTQVVLIERAPTYTSALTAIEMLTARGLLLAPKAIKHLEARNHI